MLSKELKTHSITFSFFQGRYTGLGFGCQRFLSYRNYRFAPLLPWMMSTAHDDARAVVTDISNAQSHGLERTRLTRRLPTTLQHLEARQVVQFVPWDLSLTTFRGGAAGYRYKPPSFFMTLVNYGPWGTQQNLIEWKRTKCMYVLGRASWREYSLCRVHKPYYAPFGGPLIYWNCMTPRHGPKLVVIFWCSLTGHGKTSYYFVRDASMSGSNEDDTTSIAKPAHLLSSRLCHIQDTIRRVKIHDLHTSTTISRVSKENKTNPTHLFELLRWVGQAISVRFHWYPSRGYASGTHPSSTLDPPILRLTPHQLLIMNNQH